MTTPRTISMCPGRIPALLSGGIERDGRIHWSQPEIVLYDTDPENCQFDPETMPEGVVVRTTDQGTLRIEMSDGRQTGFWACDRGLLEPGRPHHVAIIVDGGPNVITFVVDGILCDGGAACIYGWGRFPPKLGRVRGLGPLQIAPDLDGQLDRLRIYNRYLRTSEAIGNHHAGR